MWKFVSNLWVITHLRGCSYEPHFWRKKYKVTVEGLKLFVTLISVRFLRLHWQQIQDPPIKKGTSDSYNMEILHSYTHTKTSKYHKMVLAKKMVKIKMGITTLIDL